MKELMAKGFNYDDIIFTDEAKIQNEKFAKKAYHNKALPVQFFSYH